VADQPFVSLKDLGDVKCGGVCQLLLPCSRQWVLRSLSALDRACGRVAAAPASQIVCGPQAARRMEELAGTGLALRRVGGSKGSPRARMCQEAISTLRATAVLAGFDLPWRFLMSV
jgi:hypothetical protein